MDPTDGPVILKGLQKTRILIYPFQLMTGLSLHVSSGDDFQNTAVDIGTAVC